MFRVGALKLGYVLPQRIERRIQFESTLEVQKRTLDIAPPDFDIAEMDERVGIGWIDPERSLQFPNRRIVIFLGEIGPSEVLST